MDVRSDTADLISYIKWCDVVKNGCDVIQSVCDIVNRVRVMTQISGCDVKRILYMWPCIVDVVSYIEAVMS